MEMPHNIIIRMISLFFLVIEVSIYIRVSSLLNNADQGDSSSTILCIVYKKYTFFKYVEKKLFLMVAKQRRKQKSMEVLKT